jgi:hypothetical protein
MARPRKPGSDRRTRKLVIWVNEVEHARYLINASQAAITPTDFARHRLCFHPEADNGASDRITHNSQLSFEHVDALNRIGTTMARLVKLAEKTVDGAPPELHSLMNRLDALLDREWPS